MPRGQWRCTSVQSGSWKPLGGTIAITPDTDGASVDMGTPHFDWDAIPLAYPMDTMELPVSWAEGDLVLERPIAVNVGNPHVVFFVPDIAAVPLERIGPTIETTRCSRNGSTSISQRLAVATRLPCGFGNGAQG